jgi:hypothetical protein
MPHTEEVIDQLQQVLSRDTKIRRSSTSNACKLAAESVAGRAMLKTMALNIGDRYWNIRQDISFISSNLKTSVDGILLPLTATLNYCQNMKLYIPK